MARPKPRNYERRPGWDAAARALSVSYSHLRRVLCRERDSKSLRARFRAWQRQQRAANRPAAASPQYQITNS